jgi:hypothetical protein
MLQGEGLYLKEGVTGNQWHCVDTLHSAFPSNAMILVHITNSAYPLGKILPLVSGSHVVLNHWKSCTHLLQTKIWKVEKAKFHNLLHLSMSKQSHRK